MMGGDFFSFGKGRYADSIVESNWLMRILNRRRNKSSKL